MYFINSYFNSAFNREWNAKLEAKRAAEARAEEQARKEAKEEFENWITQKDTRLNARKETNRTEEQVFLEQQESDLESANVWDRVTKLIDLQADFSSESGVSDVSRMRKLFLQLKNEPLETTRAIKVEA